MSQLLHFCDRFCVNYSSGNRKYYLADYAAEAYVTCFHRDSKLVANLLDGMLSSVTCGLIRDVYNRWRVDSRDDLCELCGEAVTDFLVSISFEATLIFKLRQRRNMAVWTVLSVR
jgi:hypothetical protein